MEPVPVAENLLETKLFGFSLKRMLQAFAIPVTPGLLLMILNFPPLLFGPVLIAGVIVGGVVYLRTPSGQNPAGWLIGMGEFYLGPSEYYWKPVQFQEDDVLIQEGDEGSYTQERPSENYESTSMIGDENTIDIVDFECIHDDGVVETEEAYALIVEITPRQWLILDQKKRDSVTNGYSTFLMGLKSPTQTMNLPVPFDASEYTDHIQQANRNRSTDESELLEYGRVRHSNWVKNIVEKGDIRDRRHFMIVTARKDKENEKEDTSGFLSSIKPGEGGGNDEVDEKQRYDALWSRANNVKNTLPRTGVEANILDDREDVLDVFYYYYRASEPSVNLDHNWLTKRDDTNRGQDTRVAHPEESANAEQASSD